MDRAHRVFLRVAETGNLTAASRQLRIAQPSLTRTIHKLEEEFGTSLFNRLPRGMELTAAGRALRAQLLEVEAVYRRAVREVEAVRRGYVETIRIGAGLVHQTLFMPAILEHMWERFPDTSFEVSTGAAETHVKSLLDGDLDIVFSAAVEEFDHPSLQVEVLFTISHGVLHWPGALPAIPETEPMPIKHLQERDWVLLVGPELRANIGRLFFKLGMPSPRVAMTTSSLSLGLDVVRRTGHVMSVPTMLRNPLTKNGFLLHQTSEPLWRARSGVAIHRANRGQEVITAMIEQVKVLAVDFLAIADARTR